MPRCWPSRNPGLSRQASLLLSRRQGCLHHNDALRRNPAPHNGWRHLRRGRGRQRAALPARACESEKKSAKNPCQSTAALLRCRPFKCGCSSVGRALPCQRYSAKIAELSRGISKLFNQSGSVTFEIRRFGHSRAKLITRWLGSYPNPVSYGIDRFRSEVSGAVCA
jgi:hypothetical protein